MDNFAVDRIIRNALEEDIGTGDITTSSCVPASERISGRFVSKADGVFCGGQVLKRVFDIVDPDITVKIIAAEGQKVAKGEVLAEIEGPAAGVLVGERTALNLVQRMSGIATAAAAAAEQVSGTGARIADTRKTVPGLRVLDKYAVKAGGGSNHRFNLADGVLIKDNHIVAAGGITAAVRMARENIPHTLKIEVETTTLDEVREALDAGADIIMLDNMDNATMRAAVEMVSGRALTEASGNMDRRSLREVAELGVDIISMGALTHTVKALDISLKFDVRK